MKKLFTALTLVCCLSLLSVGTAQAIYIADQYWGYNDHGWGDVIGATSVFDIQGMEVSVVGNDLHVGIISNYFNDIGNLGTVLGDLFISTDGWNPKGSYADNFKYDYANSTPHTTWEYALKLSNYTPTFPTGSGIASLYATTQGSIKLSQDIFGPGHSGYTYREGQEVQFAPDLDEDALATGSWSFSTYPGDSSDPNMLEFVISLNGLGWDLNNLAFHWAPSCANDVIEGAAVPEPATMLLLGTGLIGLAGFSRKKFLKKS